MKTKINQLVRMLKSGNTQAILTRLTTLAKQTGQNDLLNLQEIMYRQDIVSSSAMIASIDLELKDCAEFNSTHSVAYLSDQQHKKWLLAHPQVHFVNPLKVTQPVALQTVKVILRDFRSIRLPQNNLK